MGPAFPVSAAIDGPPTDPASAPAVALFGPQTPQSNPVTSKARPSTGQLPAGQIPPPYSAPGGDTVPPPVLPEPGGGRLPTPVPAVPPAEPTPVPPVEPVPGEPLPPVPESAIPPTPLEPGAVPPTPDAAAGPSLSDVAPPGLETAPAAPAAGFGSAGMLAAAEELGGIGSTFSFAAPEVMGDAFGIGILQRFPPIPNPPPVPPGPGVPPRPINSIAGTQSAAVIPSIRTLKISENQSPIPTNRLIYSFNYYNQVNYDLNHRFNAPISDVNIYRHIFGFEKTLFDGYASFGVRAPINTINANSPIPGIGKQSTAINLVNVFFKGVIWQNEDRSRLISGGLSLGAPTGPGTFAGAPWLANLKAFELQPFLGLYYYRNRFFFQGFTSVEVPIAERLPTLLMNDYAIGYFLYQAADPDQFLTAIAPVFEVHVNTPLNHRGVNFFSTNDVPDFVVMTYGTSFQFGRRTRLLTGVATPVSGPRVFDIEAMALLNVYF